MTWEAHAPRRKAFLSTPSARRATGIFAQEFNSRVQPFLSTPSARRATSMPWSTPIPATHFYPRPPRGGRHRKVAPPHDSEGFLSTPSARRATIFKERLQPHIGHFYPRPPRGGRLPQCKTPGGSIVNFYPRPPRGGRPITVSKRSGFIVFLSTPSARRATEALLIIFAAVFISIHALREEGDNCRASTCLIRPIFLSTPSARRATSGVPQADSSVGISIHALREEGDPES